jgi:cytochrome P450
LRCRDFADGTINILMANFLPKAFASKGIAGREAVTRAMMKYFAENSYLEASALVQARYTTMKNNIADTDIARFETVNGIAILANTVPTAFWAIFHTFADAVLLEKVRSQVEAITSISEDGSIRTINLRRLKEAPIISSTIQESLRHRSTGTGPRMIMEDIRIGGSLLKKGSVAIIANKILHFNQNAWGPDFEKFNVDRFINKFPAHAFRGFGGGANTCPGKAFAMVEVGALIAMLVMRFDLKPISTEQWEEPGQDLTNMSLQIAPPERRPIVSFVARPGTKDITWEFSQ